MGNINFFCHLSGGSEKISGETKAGGGHSASDSQIGI